MKNYRPEIDGLRAIAVLLVIFYHFGFTLFQGGYIGVDVFFVISGYLISGILYKNIENKTFSLLGFYERRVRRIIPALYLVIIITVPFSWILLTPESFMSFSKGVVSVVLFVSNIVFSIETGYFAPFTQLNPIIHTWSLSVEEQFYIFFPIILLLAFRFFRKYIIYILILGFLTSIIFTEYKSHSIQSENFFILYFRCWELLAGALIAWHERARGTVSFGSMDTVLSLSGVLLILASAMFMFDNRIRHPSLYTLIPVAGTSLIILSGRTKGLANSILAHKIFVGIGLISYSLYLWHQPIFTFLKLYSIDEISNFEFLITFILLISVSFISWKYVETPFRQAKRISTVKLWRFYILSTIFILCLGLYGIYLNGASFRFPEEVNTVLSTAKNDNPKHARCITDTNRRPKYDCILGDVTSKPTWALVGDSHASVLATGLSDALKEKKQALLLLARGGCLYSPGFDRATEHMCADWSHQVREILLASDIKNIVLAGRYVAQREGTRFDDLEGGKEIPIRNPVGYWPIDDKNISEPRRRQLVEMGFQKSIEDLLAHGKKVMLVYPVPEVGWHIQNRIPQLFLHNIEISNFTTSFYRYKERSSHVFKIFDKIEAENLIRIYPHQLFCNTFVIDRCITNYNGVSFYKDYHHLSNEGAKLVVEEIISYYKNSDKGD